MTLVWVEVWVQGERSCWRPSNFRAAGQPWLFAVQQTLSVLRPLWAGSIKIVSFTHPASKQLSKHNTSWSRWSNQLERNTFHHAFLGDNGAFGQNSVLRQPHHSSLHERVRLNPCEVKRQGHILNSRIRRNKHRTKASTRSFRQMRHDVSFEGLDAAHACCSQPSGSLHIGNSSVGNELGQGVVVPVEEKTRFIFRQNSQLAHILGYVLHMNVKRCKMSWKR